MSDVDPRDLICRVGASLHARRYVHGSAGNISVRMDDGSLVITPTDSCLGALDPDQLSVLDASGRHVGGEKPSKTVALHRAIYAADGEARCVIHTHSTHLVAMTLLQDGAGVDLLPPITPYFVMKVGHVPVIPYHCPGSPAVAEVVSRCIGAMRAAGTPIRAVMLSRLGPNVWHRSPHEASAVLEELEETARLWMLTGANPLSDAQIQELRERHHVAW